MVSEETYVEFKKSVNMQAAEIEKWLERDESKEVGQKEGDGESTGHKSGKSIVKILRKKKDELTSEDEHQMKRTISYVHRHLAQKPEGDLSETPWRYSLMNWGHDPLKSE